MTLMEQWRAMEARRRNGLLIGVGMIVLFVAAASYFLLRSNYVPIFADLSPQDSATLVSQLETSKTPYRVDSANGAVEVPEDEVAKVRAGIVGRGFPLKNPTGFELFDSGDFGMTEFTEKINYRRALEGELARTIMSLDSVRFARLHLVLPESSLFKRDRDPPKASVLIVTISDRKISADQVAGIQRMVASAVPGLTPDAVSVHDHRGVNLAEAGADPGGAIGISAKESIEAYLSSKVVQILGSLYPKTSIAVSVDATLRSGRLTSSHESQSGSAMQTVVAPKPRHVPMREDGDDSQLLDEESGLNHPVQIAPTRGQGNVDRTVEQSEEMPGQIERVTVAVILPDPLPQNEALGQIRDLVSAAVGADFDRGDHIAVYSMRVPPGNPMRPDGMKGPDTGNPAMPGSSMVAREFDHADRMRYLPWALFCVLAMIYLLFMAFVIRKPSRVADLAPAERQAMLEKVRVWLNEPETVRGVRR